MKKSYIYANSQVLAQHDGDDSNDLYFYMHDRLGSTRQLIDTDANTVNLYTYQPFGELFPSEANETITNPFKFTGQWFDSEIDQYFLRARMYDPVLGRFTSRDPVKGKYKEPMTLHAYLYCLNDPTNRVDITGKFSIGEVSTSMGIKGFVFGAMLGGSRNALLGKSWWKGALAGGLAGGTPAFFGAYGVMAAMASGGINAGVSAGLDGRSIERVLAETGAGIVMGAAMYGITNWSVNNFMDAHGLPADVQEDFNKLFGPIMGSAGGDIAHVLIQLIWGTDDEEG